MAKSDSSKTAKKLMTAKDVQEEYFNMDIRRVRALLNRYCTYRKIGRTYYYLRKEVEELLCDTENSYELPLKED